MIPRIRKMKLTDGTIYKSYVFGNQGYGTTINLMQYLILCLLNMKPHGGISELGYYSFENKLKFQLGFKDKKLHSIRFRGRYLYSKEVGYLSFLVNTETKECINKFTEAK